MAGKVHLNKSDQDNIFRFLRLLKQGGVKVSRAILFGSFAKGKAGAESDIDIAVISKQFGGDKAKEMMFLRKIALRVDSHIEPIPLSPDDLKDPYSTLVQEIKRYGKDLGAIQN